jgi:tRNA isopentenyl-2-thiomethyl-A-37 hydroxylase MiaE
MRLEYDEMFAFHERFRWSPSKDLPPFANLVPELVDNDLSEALTALAITEFSSIAAILDLVNVFSDDPDVTAWLSIWYSEEVRHHLVLRQIIEVLGRISHFEMPAINRPSLGAPKPAATLAVNVLSEIRTCWLYAGLARHCQEPVLKSLLTHVAGDEGRHAKGFAHFAQLYVRRNPALAIPSILRVGELWMNPEYGLNNANPAAENYQDRETADQMSELHARYVDRKREEEAVCKSMSEICGMEIESHQDFSRELSKLRQPLKRGA